jgi:hypothetical protein
MPGRAARRAVIKTAGMAGRGTSGKGTGATAWAHLDLRVRRKCRSHFLRSVLALAGLYGWSARGLGCGDRVWAGQGCSGKGGSQAALAGDDPDGKRARGYLGEKLLDDGMVAAVFLGLEPS